MNLDEIDDRSKPDFRRANGSPQIIDRDGKNQRYGRPSNYAKPLDDESALTNWRIDTACMGVASARDLQARWVALDPEDRPTRKELREAAIQQGRGSEGADTGTAIHKMTDRWENPDDDFNPPEPYLTQLQAYTAEMDRLGLRSVHFEQALVNDEYRVAGTTDRVYELTRPLLSPHAEIVPAGILVIGDTKTTRRIEYSYPSYAAQMALYAGGTFYDVTTDEYLETPVINQDWAIIMHIPSDGTTCEAQWVDLEAGRWGAYLSQQVKQWRKKWRSGEYHCPKVQPMPGNVTQIADKLGGEIVTEAEADAEIDGWMDVMKPWAQERVTAIGQHPDARSWLVTQWPKGLPTPKQGIGTQTQMTELLDYLDSVERRFELAFVPNPGATKGLHQSQINTTNHPGNGARKAES